MSTEPFMMYCPCCNNLCSSRTIKCPKCSWTIRRACSICQSLILFQPQSCPECGDPEPFSSSKGVTQETPIRTNVIAVDSTRTSQLCEGNDSPLERNSGDISTGPIGVRGWLLFLVVQMTLIGPVLGG